MPAPYPGQEWPNGSLESLSLTDPGSCPSGPPTTSMRYSSTSGGGGVGVAGTTTASEWAPQPWSTETTCPSSGASSWAQAPKACRSAPASGTKKPQDAHDDGAARAIGASGPRSPAYQRST